MAKRRAKQSDLQVLNWAADSAKLLSLKVELLTLRKVNKDLKEKIKDLEQEIETLSYRDDY